MTKVALVTGSATGIGRAAAVRFAREGLAVAVNYSRSEKEAKETLAQVQAHGVPAILCQAERAGDALPDREDRDSISACRTGVIVSGSRASKRSRKPIACISFRFSRVARVMRVAEPSDFSSAIDSPIS